MRELQPYLNEEVKDLMEKLLSAGEIKHKYALRLQTILLRNQGKGTRDISEFLSIHQSTVSLYINRYNEAGINALLHDKTRKPGKNQSVRKSRKNYAASYVRKNQKMKRIGAYGHWQSGSVSAGQR
ncbi:MAG: helix-turn-helix domain-containing protein [Treponema sp.]|jgi:transposase|nr:helix-turn-helix domain-containing protein [Treponema sp.]